MTARDYSATPLARKLGIKEGVDLALVRTPRTFGDSLAPLPPGVSLRGRPAGSTDIVVTFVTSRDDLERRFSRLARGLPPRGALWIAWPKKSSSIDSDLSFQSVQDVGLEAGLVDNKSCSIDDDWQALRFVYRLKDRAKG